jgi:hypothetical protein
MVRRLTAGGRWIRTPGSARGGRNFEPYCFIFWNLVRASSKARSEGPKVRIQVPPPASPRFSEGFRGDRRRRGGRAAPAIGDGIRVRTVALKLGQHNAEVFGRIGVTGLEIKALREKRVL